VLETLRKPSATTASAAERVRSDVVRRWYPLTIAAITLFGFVIRAVRILRYDFPLNDGGLFYVMAQDLHRSHYLLPFDTAYNGAGIPYAYSPLGMYVAEILHDVTRLSLPAIFRIVPLLVCTGMIVAFFFLAREILRARVAVIAAVLSFVLIPRSFVWLLMGGGLTRAFGMFFAIIALYYVHRLYTRRDTRIVIPAAIYSALTILSHLETGKFLAYSVVIFFLCYGLHRHGVIASALLGAGTLALTAPWWGTVLAYHGLQPFLAANQTGSSVFTGPADRMNSMRMLHVFGLQTNEPYFWLIGTFGLLGGLIWLIRALAASSRRAVVLPSLPIWWFAIVILDNRAAGTYTTLPVALLAGIGIADMLIPALRRAAASAMPPAAETAVNGATAAPRWTAAVARSLPVVVVLSLLLAYATVSVMTTNTDVSGDLPSLTALTKDQRAAMEWMATNTPPGSQVIVVSGIGAWPNDMISEWFPALSQRVSVATPQGYEWMPDKAFIGRIFRHDEAQACAGSDGNCLERWIPKTGTHFDYVFVRTDAQCCILATNLLYDARYELVYGGPGAMIFARQVSDTTDSAAANRVAPVVASLPGGDRFAAYRGDADTASIAVTGA
jgi:hypothetical protein